MEKCEGDYPKDTSSSKCQPDQKCCVVDNECESKRGKCAETYPDGGGYVEFNKYLQERKNMLCAIRSFREHILIIYRAQKGEGGLGFIVQPDDMNTFDSNNYYAITFCKSRETMQIWIHFGYGTVTAVLGAGTLAATWFSPQ